MRCLALVQACQDAGGSASFVMAMKAQAVEARLALENMEVIHLSAQPGSRDDAVQTADLARKMGASWVVVDGYHFGADYQRMIKDAGLRLLLIDDTGQADHYYADIILNQNLHAHESLYSKREPYTRLLLGTRYVLLRREFLKWRGWKRVIPEVARKVLVTLGGADLHNVTLQVIQALQWEWVEVKALEAMVILGGSNPHYEKLQGALRHSRIPIRLENNVMEMPDLLAWADMAVSAGGTTCWELAFMGLPGLILILADNQRSIVEELGKRGGAVNLGWHADLSAGQIACAVRQLSENADLRSKIARCGRQLVDGEGGIRTARALLNDSRGLHADSLSRK